MSEELETPPEEEPVVEESDQDLIVCANCGCERRRFVFVDGLCDACRTVQTRESRTGPEVDWPEVRERRDRLLRTTDWTQMADVDPAVSSAWVDVRQRLRDVPEAGEVPTAWDLLDNLESEIAAK